MRIKRRWLIYVNEHASRPFDDGVRHLICERCHRQYAFNDDPKWYTRKTRNWHLTPCAECLDVRKWKEEK